MDGSKMRESSSVILEVMSAVPSREYRLLYKQWEGETRNASISTGSSGLLIPNY
jgi:hypothetical protein